VDIPFDVDFDGRVCVGDLTFNGTPLRVVNIYAPVGTERLDFLSQQDKYLLTRLTVIMGGDFSLVLHIAMDRLGGNPNGSIGSPELKRYQNII
jgi:hypothetical protein